MQISRYPKVIKCTNCDNLFKNFELISWNTIWATFYSDWSFYASMLPKYTKITKCDECWQYFFKEDAEIFIEHKYREYEYDPRKEKLYKFIDEFVFTLMILLIISISFWVAYYFPHIFYKDLSFLNYIYKILIFADFIMLWGAIIFGYWSGMFYKSEKIVEFLKYKFSKKQQIEEYEEDEIDLHNKDYEELLDKAESIRWLTIEEYVYFLKNWKYNLNQEKYLRRDLWHLYNKRVKNWENLFQSDEDKLNYESNLERLLVLYKDFTDEWDTRLLIWEMYRNLWEFDECIKVLEGFTHEDYINEKEIILWECKKGNAFVVIVEEGK